MSPAHSSARPTHPPLPPSATTLPACPPPPNRNGLDLRPETCAHCKTLLALTSFAPHASPPSSLPPPLGFPAQPSPAAPSTPVRRLQPPTKAVGEGAAEAWFSLGFEGLGEAEAEADGSIVVLALFCQCIPRPCFHFCPSSFSLLSPYLRSRPEKGWAQLL